jgi:hypothetical protein
LLITSAKAKESRGSGVPGGKREKRKKTWWCILGEKMSQKGWDA